MTLVALVLAQCFVMNDRTPGWKQIALPPDAPQLAAPESYEQFRVADPVVVTHSLSHVLLASYRPSPGRHAFEFALPEGTKTVTLSFAQPLHSSKVDAVVHGSRGRMSLLDERRIAGKELVLSVPLPEASRAVVTVHSHLRDVPALESATVTAQGVPLRSPVFPARFQIENSLYVRTFGEPVTLCQRPAQPLSVTVRGLEDSSVRSTTLTLATPR